MVDLEGIGALMADKPRRHRDWAEFSVIAVLYIAAALLVALFAFQLWTVTR